MAWSRKHPACISCGATRRKHKAKGLCSKCYLYAPKLQVINAWNYSNIDNLKYFPKEFLPVNQTKFDKIKLGLIKQYQNRLNNIKSVESKLQGVVTGIDVEYMLQNIVALSKAKDKNMFHSIAGTIDLNFNSDQKKLIYKLLNEIEENVPWKGINWADILIK